MEDREIYGWIALSQVCFSVRKARTYFNEAKLISWSIYNIAIVNIAMASLQ